MIKLHAVLLMGFIFSVNTFAEDASPVKQISFTKENGLAKIDLRATVLQLWKSQDTELYNVLFTGTHKGVFDLSAITYVQYQKLQYWQQQAPVLFTETFAAAWPESMRKDYTPKKLDLVSTPNETVASRSNVATDGGHAE